MAAPHRREPVVPALAELEAAEEEAYAAWLRSFIAEGGDARLQTEHRRLSTELLAAIENGDVTRDSDGNGRG